jgi:hypothetical protein
MRFRSAYRDIQKSLTGLADAKLSKIRSRNYFFDDNTTHALFFHAKPRIELSGKRALHFDAIIEVSLLKLQKSGCLAWKISCS